MASGLLIVVYPSSPCIGHSIFLSILYLHPYDYLNLVPSLWLQKDFQPGKDCYVHSISVGPHTMNTWCSEWTGRFKVIDIDLLQLLEISCSYMCDIAPVDCVRMILWDHSLKWWNSILQPMFHLLHHMDQQYQKLFSNVVLVCILTVCVRCVALKISTQHFAISGHSSMSSHP
jgi:membrane protein insertase Oxa1/YidC/SpoIIIJ